MGGWGVGGWMDRWQAEFVTNSQFDVTGPRRLGKLKRFSVSIPFVSRSVVGYCWPGLGDGGAGRFTPQTLRGQHQLFYCVLLIGLGPSRCG